MLGAYVAARFAWLPFRSNQTLSLIASTELHWRVWTFFKCIPIYLGLFIAPITLYVERQFVTTTLLDPVSWLGLTVLCGSLVFGWRWRGQRPAILFGVCWWLISLGPTCNIIPLPITMAEHWAYVPSVGLFWILADVLARSGLIGWCDERGRLCNPLTQLDAFLPAIMLAVIVLSFSARAYLRSLEWKNGETLYTADLRYAKRSFILHTNLGVVLFRQGRPDEAAAAFDAALEIAPNYGTALSNRGVISMRRGNLPKAERYFRRAITTSGYALAYGNLALVLMATGRPEEAEKILRAGLARYPHDETLRGHFDTLRTRFTNKVR